MRILLLSAYDAYSHRVWREVLVANFPEHSWQVLILPPRYFSWRIRGNSLSWAMSERTSLEQGYDLVIATSMVDLATLKGLVPALARTPSILYFHENQFAYPTRAYPAADARVASIEPQMVTLYAALAADQLVFNSDYNRRTYLAGVDELLGRFPDAVPDGVVDLLRNRSRVIPVPLAAVNFAGDRVRGARDSLHIVWNHRWEYDKGPERLLAIVTELIKRQVDFELSVLGQRFRHQPEEFTALQEMLATHPGRVRHWGYIESADDYRAHLRTGDIVLSTALHDFQGLSVLEAVAAGCTPLLPDRLCYPEWFARDYLYASDSENPYAEAQYAADAIRRLANPRGSGRRRVAPDVSAFGWPALRDRYAKLIER